MPTQKVLDGGLVILSADGVPFECLTDVTINKTKEARDTTCKNSEGVKTSVPGAKDWSIDFSMNYLEVAENSGKTFKDLDTYYEDDTEITARFGSSQSGDTYWEGPCFINSLSIVAGNTGTNVTASGTITSNGPLVRGTNP